MDYDYKKYDAKKVDEFINSYARAVDRYTVDSSSVEAGYMKYRNNSTYLGEAADASKQFIGRIQLERFHAKNQEIQKELYNRCVDIREMFKSRVDAAPNAKIDTDTLDNIKKEHHRIGVVVEDNGYKLESMAKDIQKTYGEFGNVTIPNYQYAADKYKEFCGNKGFIDKCAEKLVTCDEDAKQYLKRAALKEKSDDFQKNVKAVARSLEGIEPCIENMEKRFLGLLTQGIENVKLDINSIFENLKKNKFFLYGMNTLCQAIGYDPVNLNNGNYLNDREDLNISGNFPLRVKRFYNALSDTSGLFGKGWTSLFDVNLLKEDEKGDVKITILFSDGHKGSYIRNLNEKKEIEYIEEHGERGKLVEYNDCYRLIKDDGTYTEFSESGKIRAFGNTKKELAKISYSGDQPCRITADSKHIELFFNEKGYISEVRDNSGRSVKYDYSEREGEYFLTFVQYPDGSIRRYDYDSDGIMNEVINPSGTTFLRNEYDDKKRITKQSFPDGGVISYAYDEEKRITTATEQNGLKVEYLSDEFGRHIGTKYPEQGINESYTYNEKNFKTSVTDKRGYTSRFSYDNRGHLTKVVDANRNVTNITYNAFGKPIAVKGPNGASYKYSYDDDGQLTRVINPLLEERRFEYNSDGLVEKIIDAEGGCTFVRYDKNNDICYVKDSKGIETFYERDDLGRVISTKNALGAVRSYEYDVMDRISKVTDPDGNVTKYFYNKSGKLLRVVNPDGTEKSWEYNNIGKPAEYVDEAGRKTSIKYNKVWDEEEVTLPNGGKISYEYDLLKRLIKITDPEQREVSYDYDENDNVIAEYNGNIKVRSITYDAVGNVSTVTDAHGAVTSYEYDASGNLIAMNDALGNRSSREYDLIGKITKETDALGNSTSYTYTKLGNIKSVTDPAGRKRRFEYENGRLVSVYFCDRIEQKLTYDELGRVVRRSFADGYDISYQYDALDRITKVEGSDGRIITYGYDAMGRAVKAADGDRVTLYTYTPTGHLKSVVDALGNETAYTYDSLDNLKSIHRAEGRISDEEKADGYLPTVGKDGRVTIYSYNLSGQLTEVTDALGQKEIYEYDQYGRLQKKTDRDNYVTSYSYNNNGVITKVGYGDGRSVEFSYNELNQLNKIKDWLGETVLENDILGRLTKVTDYQDRTVSYEYNSIGERTKLIYPDGREAVYTYDTEGKLSGILGNGTKTGYIYDAQGRLTEKILPNGIKQEYSYLPGGNLESMTSSDKDGILDEYLYSYDRLGLLNGINRNRRGLDAVSGHYRYSYDAIGRLIKTTHDGVKKASYKYDAFGNRISLSDNDAETSYTYDVLDRLVQTKENINGCDIIKTYAYDNRGNQTEEYVNGLLEKSYTFDAANVLSKAVDRERGKVENTYNGLGFRVASTRPEEKIEYLCDLSRDYYNLLERTVNGETESFVYDNNVVSMSKAGDDYYYLQDELGSPMYMTGTDGETVSTYAFDDFGRNIDPFTGKQKKAAYTTDGNIIQPFAFTGYQEDEVSGLKFAQARFYDAGMGRFISCDLFSGYKHNAITQNRYSYCINDAINRVDLNGKKDYIYTNHDTYTVETRYKTFLFWKWEDKKDRFFIEVNGVKYEALSKETCELYDWKSIDTEFLDAGLDALVDKANEKDTDFNRIYKESVGGELDFKLQLDESKLYLIDGVLYNRNEVGNFVWAYFLESKGYGKLNGILAQGGSIVGSHRLDEEWDTTARHKGTAYYKKRQKKKECDGDD